MKYQMQRAQMYLNRFNEILNQMECKMLSPEVTNSITINFIRCMIPHHQAAIYMSQNLLKYTNYQPLQKIAKGIIEMQTRGIEQMTYIEQTTSGYINPIRDVNNYMNGYVCITKEMVEKMRNSLKTININLDFTTEMIPHHDGAIAMCNNLLQYYIDPRLKEVADTIIKEQSRGVDELKNIQRNLYG